MQKDEQRSISIVGPEEFTGLRLTQPKDHAAGISAVKIALDHALKEMGLKKSFETLSKMNQKSGFDCPGCAWPDPEKRSSLGEFCENGVKAIAEEATRKRVDPDFFKKHSITELSHWSDFEIGKSGRVTHPMILHPGSHHYEPIDWDKAFEMIGRSIGEMNNANEAVFYTSGRSSNEAAFLYGLFARVLGTNNMPDCSNMCHESSGAALGETLGIGKGSVTLDDLYKAEVVIVMGQNPGTNHPRMLSALEKCKKSGGTIVSINPLAEAGLIRFKNPQEFGGILGSGTKLTDLHLQVKINQDVPLLKLVQKKLAELDAESGDVLDHEFINSKTSGFDALMADLNDQDPKDLLNRSGLKEDEVNQLVSLLATNKRIIICWAMGLTQHKNGVDNIKECVNLLLMKGSIGIPGGGTCPVRGHSNVQGDRTVGIMHHASPKLNASLKKVFGFDPPAEEGLDVVKSIKAMHEGKIKVFMTLGGNFLSAASDTLYTGQALQNCDLTVHVTTKLNRTHLVPGKTSLILPTLGRSEQDGVEGKSRFVTVENSMGRVHRSQGRLLPASDQLRSEPEIVAGIAKASLKKQSDIDWLRLGRDYDLIREKISLVFQGFDKYTERSDKGGFDLPNHAREGDFSKLPGGRAKFSVCALPEHRLKENEFLMMTIRTHDQYNTTIYGLDDRYRGIYNERRVVLMNPDDVKRLQLKPREVVDVVSLYSGVERRARNFLIIPYNIPKGNLAAYFPETNVLIPNDQYAEKSQTPISKSIQVSLQKVE